MKSLIIYYMPWRVGLPEFGFDDYERVRVPGAGFVRAEVVEGDLNEAECAAITRKGETFLNAVPYDVAGENSN